MTPTHALGAILVMVLWGLNFPVAKIGLEQFPPLAMMALRFTVVAALVVPFVKMPKGRIREIALLSFTLGFLHFSLMFNGLQYVDAAVAAVTIQIQVPFAAVLGMVLFGDTLGWRRWLGMGVAIAGVAILAGEPRAGSPWWAVGLIVMAAMVWACANIQMKKLSDVNGLAVNGWMGLFAAPQLALGSLILEDGQIEAIRTADLVAWGSIAYQAVLVVIFCYGVWYWLLNRYPLSQAMPYTLLVPVFGVMSGVALLGEPVSLQLVIGAAATIVGVAIILIRRPATIDTKIPTS
ncbi:EamA family transporter [Inquilinus sp. CAU 1745]|uniref:DMT family transporter n=1 Tax=Inquilinus sp. CAU 1745 TaxID=3140369 RepID=UPI00325BF403